MSIIETKKLTKYYLNGKILGVKNLDLSINEGEIFGFIGPNGAGKSTTIRLLLDLIRPTSGNAQIFRLDSHQKTVQVKKEVGYLPGEIYLPEFMTGKDCINYYRGFKNNVDSDYLKRLLKKLGLDVRKKIGDYSKGNKQKLAIVLALMHKPKILILDEPTSGLDPLNQQEFYNLILETKGWGTTTFFSTHILSEAEKLCDRVGIIKNGKLLRVENIEEFRQKNIREVHLETKESIPLSSFEIKGIRKVSRTTWGYHLVTVGKNAETIKKLSALPFEDMKIYEPSLEEIFLHFYKE